MPRDWNADRYAALPLPHVKWGARTQARLPLTGDEHVLDAGCGPGRDTLALLERLPRGRVTAVDASSQMLIELRKRVPDEPDRMEVIHADLTQPLPVRRRVDAIFSVATFHWITDHQALFLNLANTLREGGKLVAECGGRNNISTINRAADEVLGRPGEMWEFPGEGETERRLRQAGFRDVDVRLRPHPVHIEHREVWLDYLRVVLLGGYLDALATTQRDEFVRAVAAQLPYQVVDYVRLEMFARL